MNTTLRFTEEFILLSINTGKIKHKTGYVAACGLIELLEMNKLKINEENKVEVIDSSKTNIDYLDLILEIINSKRAKNFKNWVDFFYCKEKIKKNIYNLILKSLEEKNIITTHKAILSSKLKGTINDTYDIDTLITLSKNKVLNSTDFNLASMFEITKLKKYYLSSHEEKVFQTVVKNLKTNEKFKIFKSIKSIVTFYDNMPAYASAIGSI